MTDSNPTASKPTRSPARVLVVDDHADTLYTTGRLLRLSGYEVTTAGGSAETVRICATQTFDVMIVDVRLGDGDGIELLKLIRQRCDVRGIVVSGTQSDEQMRSATEAGVTAYLLKPVAFDRLLAAVEAAADGR
jgi:CheY-like chemotaxis protein